MDKMIIVDLNIFIAVNVSIACCQRTGLGDGGEIYILPPERQPMKELKYRISTKVHQRIFSPELLMNSEQKADEMHVRPAIAKPTVSRILVNLPSNPLCYFS